MPASYKEIAIDINAIKIDEQINEVLNEVNIIIGCYKPNSVVCLNNYNFFFIVCKIATMAS